MGIELHLVTMQEAIDKIKPSLVVLDPISTLIDITSVQELKCMLTRSIDYFKANHITSVFTDFIGPIS